MSFQTFNLFNFFQQPNTGKIPQPGVFSRDQVVNGSNPSPNKGRVADFNWNFPYLERAIPLQVFQKGDAQNSIFPIILFSDSFLNSASGIRTPFFSTSISGRFLKDINEETASFNLSGKFFPHNRNFNYSTVGLSGIFNEDPKQENIFNNKISGEIINSIKDKNSFYQDISGAFIDLRSDNNLSEINISGFLEKNYYDESLNKIIISGNFFPLIKDLFNIDYSVTGFFIFKAPDILNQSFDDIFNLDYNITGYTAI